MEEVPVSKRSHARRKRYASLGSSHESGPAPKVACSGGRASGNDEFRSRIHRRGKRNHYPDIALSHMAPKHERHSGRKTQHFVENEDSHLNFKVGDINDRRCGGASGNDEFRSRIHCRVKRNHYPDLAVSNVTPKPEQHSGRKAQHFVENEDSHLNFKIGDIIDLRYKILGFLGKGSFGRVARAYDRQEFRHVALKIIRNTESCRESGRTEIQLMKTLYEIDPRNYYLWVQMFDYFEFKGHIFIAFEELGDDLYTFLKENKHQPYQMSHIRHIAYQLIYSVKALHDHFVVHADLKPENICFLSSQYTFGICSLQQKTYRKVLDSTIRLIDFGSAIHSTDDYQGIIQTIHYRCPEVVFGMDWSYACDTWSIGCILFELYTGSCLFFVTEDKEHVNAMTDVLGPLPDIYKDTPLGQSMWEDYVPLPQRKSKTGCKPLRKYMFNSSLEHCQLFDLLEVLLQYDPLHRIPLSRALKHPFFELLPNNLKCKEKSNTFYKAY